MSKVDVLALMLKYTQIPQTPNLLQMPQIKTKALKSIFLEIYEIKPLKHRECSRSKGKQRLKEKKLKAYLGENVLEEKT